MNRAPTLHRLGIQAFHPRLIEGNAIQLHPLVCTAFNADFDGDQMAVHLPLSKEARWEADNLMAAEKNMLKPATGSPVITPSQDIVLGCFYLTRYVEGDEKRVKIFGNEKEAMLAYKSRIISLHQKIKIRFTDLTKFEKGQSPILETSIGRMIYNSVLPENMPYYNEVVGKKKLGKIISLHLEYYGQEKTALFLDELKNLGFKYATKAGYSLGMDDFPKVTEKGPIVKEAEGRVRQVEEQYQEGLLTQAERHAKIIEIWTETKDKVVAGNAK